MESINIFIDNIRLLASKKGWNGADVVRESKQYGGIAQRTISNILRNPPVLEKVNPTVTSLDVFAKTFGVDVKDLLTQRGDSTLVKQEDLAKSIRNGFSLLVEAGLVDETHLKPMVSIIDKLAVAQYHSLVMYETGDHEIMLKGMLRLVAKHQS